MISTVAGRLKRELLIWQLVCLKHFLRCGFGQYSLYIACQQYYIVIEAAIVVV